MSDTAPHAPQMRTREEQLKAQLATVNRQLEAVLKLHSRTNYDRTQCYCGNAYPCRTVQAIANP